MFYCDNCATEKGWPNSSFKSRGQCEMCRQAGPCNDVPSDQLPAPIDEIMEDQVKINKMIIAQSYPIKATNALRFVNRNVEVEWGKSISVSILQQAWQNAKTGHITWEDVPTETE